MEQMLDDLSPAALVVAIEENIFAFLWQAQQIFQTELHDDPELLWTMSAIPLPLFNQVARARFMATEASAAVAATIRRYQERQVPMLWWTGPATRPADLGAVLLAHGLLHAGDLPGMAVDLKRLSEGTTWPDGLSVARVAEAEAAHAWCRVCAAGFEHPDLVIDPLVQGLVRQGFGPDIRLRCYLGRLGETPVAMASLALGAGVAGIYNVTTLAEARRRGIGTAITLAALRDAAALGYRVGVLQSTELGLDVYQRLGFQTYCTLGQYIWTGTPAERGGSSDGG